MKRVGEPFLLMQVDGDNVGDSGLSCLKIDRFLQLAIKLKSGLKGLGVTMNRAVTDPTKQEIKKESKFWGIGHMREGGQFENLDTLCKECKNANQIRMPHSSLKKLPSRKLVKIELTSEWVNDVQEIVKESSAASEREAVSAKVMSQKRRVQHRLWPLYQPRSAQRCPSRLSNCQNKRSC